MSDDFSRSMFREDDFETIDETWTHGAYIGGMAGAHEDLGIAADYFRAADDLVDAGFRGERVYEVVLPALFLYRHALELRLKNIVRPAKFHHGLGALVSSLDEKLAARGLPALTSEFVARVRELADMDPGADAFRFHHARPKAKGASPEPHFETEVWVDLIYVREVMAWLARELDRYRAQLK